MILIATSFLLFCVGTSLAVDNCISLQPQTSCGPKQTMVNEGECLCCYYDTKKIPTIGIGFNLRRPDASTVLAEYQLNLSDVLQDCQKKTTYHCLTDQQAQDIFLTLEYPEFEQCVDQFAPGLPSVKRAAIIDMAFMGCNKLHKFKKMQAALQKRDWNTAANEAKNSKWCSDVGPNRCNSDYNCIKGCTGQTCDNYTSVCSKTNPDCVCYKTSDGNSLCGPDIYCSELADCSSCPSNTGVCVVDSCCHKPVCFPLSAGKECEDSPTLQIKQSKKKSCKGECTASKIQSNIKP